MLGVALTMHRADNPCEQPSLGACEAANVPVMMTETMLTTVLGIGMIAAGGGLLAAAAVQKINEPDHKTASARCEGDPNDPSVLACMAARGQRM